MSRNRSSEGFGAVGVLMAVVVVAALAFSGWFVWHKNNDDNFSNKTDINPASQANKTNEPAIDPYDGWGVYTDVGYAQSSGISVRYPSDWQVNTGNNKAFAWTISHKIKPTGSINVRVISLDSSVSAKQEWDGCTSADACGPAPGDTKIDSSSTTVNGLDTYRVKIKGTTDTYYATVVKSDKSSSDGTTSFVEFLLYSDDATLVNAYRQIVASASFLN